MQKWYVCVFGHPPYAPYQKKSIWGVSILPAGDRVKVLDNDGVTGIYIEGRHTSLRYVATIQFNYASKTVKARLAPVAVSPGTQIARIRGKEVCVSMTTTLMGPFILSGAGQGGRSGASGLLADVIRVAQRLRGRT